VTTWWRRRLDPDERYGLRITLLAVAAVLLAIPFSYLVLQVTRGGPLTGVDRSLADWMHDQIAGDGIRIAILNVITTLGSSPVLYVLTGIGVVFFWRRGSRRTAIYLAVTAQVAGWITLAIKSTVGRPRPGPDENLIDVLGKSFPSGHALNSTVVYGVLLLAFMPLIPRRWRVWCVVGYGLLIAAIAASRVGLVVHYLSDVLAGIVLGLAWLAVATATFSHWREERGETPVHVLDGAAPEIASSSRSTRAGS
jgi:undecaprenyl-diphosphatase